ncbi:hypothetical protein BDV95DRAFT_573956 [Massariosphaeria phaeospora]|uniref:Regulator of phospholipase D SRF1 n=1 Tax=Massariosphaeria phaeospora TaxID=100035 RepID=A0A7C8ICA6_9PLEO|nr:hypothetical protein BDV95DRAFT_573956 [Massariosphaeria phaeospora]
MTGRPMVEQSNATPFLNPNARPQGHLLPSPLPPPSASSLSLPRPQSGVSAASSNPRDDRSEGTAVRKSHSHSVSSNPLTVTSSRSKGSLSQENRDKQRAVRTLPPWVQSPDDDDTTDPTTHLLPRTPTQIRPASHNHMPTPKDTVRGRKFDHAREGVPVTLTTPVSETASKWQQFAKASEYDPNRPEVPTRGEVMSDDWIKENLPDLEEPWHPLDEEEEEQEKGFWLFNRRRRTRRVDRWHRTIMNHPMVPLAIRLIILAFSVLALSLAGAIYRKSDSAGCDNNSSTWMALVVDIVAIIYTAYITWDEYTSKPLGLRSHNAKMRLIFLDLAFIVFDSANLSLAFQSLTDERWACRDGPDTEGAICPYVQDICVRQKALTATLLIALVAWISTFAISTLRLIERVAR